MAGSSWEDQQAWIPWAEDLSPLVFVQDGRVQVEAPLDAGEINSTSITATSTVTAAEFLTGSTEWLYANPYKLPITQFPVDTVGTWLVVLGARNSVRGGYWFVQLDNEENCTVSEVVVAGAPLHQLECKIIGANAELQLTSNIASVWVGWVKIGR